MFAFKVLFLAAVMVCFGNFNVYASISAEQKAAIKAAMEPFIEECVKEFGYTEEQVEDFKKNHKPSDMEPCFMSCFFKKAGIFDNKGLYDVDKAVDLAKNYIKNEDDLAVVEKIKQDCAKVNDAEVTDGDKGCERAKLLFECFKSHKELVDIEKD